MDTQHRLISSLPYKSTAASILLTFFFGPIGLLYSSFGGALILTILIVPGLFIPTTHSTLFIITTLWLLCSFWGALSTNRYNKKLLTKYAQPRNG